MKRQSSELITPYAEMQKALNLKKKKRKYVIGLYQLSIGLENIFKKYPRFSNAEDADGVVLISSSIKTYGSCLNVSFIFIRFR